MNRIILNDEPQTAEIQPETWGDLLETLDRRCAAGGHVLTAVRFDGVDQPAFRQQEILAASLSEISVVEAQSTTPQALLLTTLEEADQASTALVGAAERIGVAFRGFDISSANDDLVEFAQGLSTMVTLANVISQAIGVPLDGLACNGTTGAAMIAELATRTESLIAAQEIGDWITVADVVEYDVAPALARWPALFSAMRASVDAVAVPGPRA